MFSTIRARNAHGGFSEKILDHSKITKMCYFSRFFGIISKTLLTIFPVFAVNVALNSIFQPAKTVCQKKIRSQDIWGSVFELFEWSKKKFWIFFEKVSKWSNSKSYHVKSEIWRPSTSPSVSHPRLSHFSAEKSKKKLFHFLTQNDSIREKSDKKWNLKTLEKISLCWASQTWSF